MKDRIRVGIIGVGNCASGLMQGIELYRTTLKGKKPIGLMNEPLGEYSIFDIDFVAAWDVGENKIGKPLTVAIMKEPNMVHWLGEFDKGSSEWWMEHNKVIVQEAPALDGIGIYVQNKIKPIVSSKFPSDLMKEIGTTIKEKQIDVLVNYLPVGSQKATEWWANIALGYGCAFVNCIPVFIASNEEWANKFKEKGLPLLGDDIKGVLGATIVHRVLAKLVDDRGASLDETYQLNFGGNSDFLNMLERSRLESKKISKTTSVQSQLQKELKADKIHVGPSDYVEFLGNTKIANIMLSGKMFAEQSYKIELKLEVDDKSNSAGCVIDTIRLARVALDRKIGGNINDASAYYFKHPMIQMSDSEARIAVEKFIEGNA